MQIRSRTPLERYLRLGGIDPEKDGWLDNGRDSVGRLLQQIRDGECELTLTLTREATKVRVIAYHELSQRKRAGKRRGRKRYVVFYEKKYAPDGTLLNPKSDDHPQEKVKRGESLLDACARLVEEEFGISDAAEDEFIFLGEEKTKKTSTRSFAKLKSRTRTYTFAWEMPPEFFLPLFIEPKEDGGINLFEAHPAPSKLLAKLGF